MLIYLDMLFTFMKISLFSFGGGYAILAMIQQEVVLKHHWLSQAEFQNIVAISQMTPGPIAINAATFVGYKQGGILGSALCTLGVITPSLVVMLLISFSYTKLKDVPWFKNIFKHLRILAIGLVAAAAILIGQGTLVDPFAFAVFGIVLIVYWKFKPNPVLMMLAAGIAGAIFG